MLEKVLIKEIVAPIVIIFSAIIIYFIFKKIMNRSIKLKFSQIDIRRHKTINGLILNIIKCILIIVVILSLLSVYGVNTHAFVTSLGVIGVVLGLAFQDILKDILSGLSIIIENQYAVGDTVTINEFKGEVLTIGLRTTRLKAYTGEVKIIANRNINEVINHSVKKSLAIVDVMVSYEDNLEEVEKVLQEVCAKMTKQITYIRGQIQLLGVQELQESGIVYRITADTKPMKHQEVQRILLREIKIAFDLHKITIPYPQLVIHNA